MKIVNFKLNVKTHAKMLRKIKEHGFDNQSAYLRFLVERDLNNDELASRIELIISTKTDNIKASVDSVISEIKSAGQRARDVRNTNN